MPTRIPGATTTATHACVTADVAANSASTPSFCATVGTKLIAPERHRRIIADAAVRLDGSETCPHCRARASSACSTVADADTGRRGPSGRGSGLSGRAYTGQIDDRRHTPRTRSCATKWSTGGHVGTPEWAMTSRISGSWCVLAHRVTGIMLPAGTPCQPRIDSAVVVLLSSAADDRSLLSPHHPDPEQMTKLLGRTLNTSAQIHNRSPHSNRQRDCAATKVDLMLRTAQPSTAPPNAPRRPRSTGREWYFDAGTLRRSDRGAPPRPTSCAPYAR